MRTPLAGSSFKSRFRRFYSFPPTLKRPEGIPGRIRLFFDRHLTVDPLNGEPIPLDRTELAKNNHARHRREYAESTQQLLDDSPEVALAWLERLRLETSWMDTAEHRKARGRSVLISFTGIFVSATGLYPNKIEALGLSFSTNSHIGFLLALIGLVWYQWASAVMLVRDFLIAMTCKELEHKVQRIYRDYENRWANYIRWQLAEKRFFYKRLPSLLAAISMLCLLTSLMRTIIGR
jgi:hypothetical protein